MEEGREMIEVRFTTFKETETIPLHTKFRFTVLKLSTHGISIRELELIEIYLDEIGRDYENEAIFKEVFENVSDMVLHVIYHELGHIVMNTDVEKYCDNFADWLLCAHTNLSKYRV